MSLPPNCSMRLPPTPAPDLDDPAPTSQAGLKAYNRRRSFLYRLPTILSYTVKWQIAFVQRHLLHRRVNFPPSPFALSRPTNRQVYTALLQWAEWRDSIDVWRGLSHQQHDQVQDGNNDVPETKAEDQSEV